MLAEALAEIDVELKAARRLMAVLQLIGIEVLHQTMSIGLLAAMIGHVKALMNMQGN